MSEYEQKQISIGFLNKNFNASSIYLENFNGKEQ